MDNVLYNQELQLSRFGEYLLKQRMTREGHERYYVYGWKINATLYSLPWPP